MTNYCNHIIGGLSITILSCYFIFSSGWLHPSLWNMIVMTIISLFFSQLPDIDIGTSRIRKTVTVIIGVIMIFAFLNEASYIGIAMAVFLIAIQFLHHRGFTHSLASGIVFSAMLFLYFHHWAFPVVAMLNFITHLVLDA